MGLYEPIGQSHGRKIYQHKNDNINSFLSYDTFKKMWIISPTIGNASNTAMAVQSLQICPEDINENISWKVFTGSVS